jgi:hypothetical protein
VNGEPVPETTVFSDRIGTRDRLAIEPQRCPPIFYVDHGVFRT